MDVNTIPAGKKIILFDGICNLCDSFVQHVIKRDSKDVFRFVALQSDTGQHILKHIGVDPAKIDSVILYEPNVAYYYKSEAVIEIMRHLSGFSAVGLLFRLLPHFLRNPLYDYIARNRYKWYGKKEKCLVLTAELKSKFLD